ncbi:MAG: hypothetical protein B6D34_04620 [Candidatus Brocadia sp. UTAMX1]|jgi:hypothetical protein|nr:MAG: hypothetical protein B6D34_04620 [Candidatus Brocadia sp. UTAMX1]
MVLYLGKNSLATLAYHVSNNIKNSRQAASFPDDRKVAPIPDGKAVQTRIFYWYRKLQLE